jgi:hypothetical protein
MNFIKRAVMQVAAGALAAGAAAAAPAAAQAVTASGAGTPVTFSSPGTVAADAGTDHFTVYARITGTSDTYAYGTLTVS